MGGAPSVHFVHICFGPLVLYTDSSPDSSPLFPITRFSNFSVLFILYMHISPSTRDQAEDSQFFSVGRRVPGPRAFHALAKFTRSPYSSIQRSPKQPDSTSTRYSPQYTFHSHSDTAADRTALATETHRPYPRDIPDPRAIVANQTGSHSITTGSSTTDSGAEACRLTR